uniref:Butyrophilin subfamily 1 member A1-like n=1 Tax=Nannospalax galili TaxID=1026970 RepID=A0A8C6RGI6_NANGA
MEDCCRCSLLHHLTCLLVLAQLPTWVSTQKFRVVGPSEPIVVVLGEEATLPCSLSPALSVEDMELRWFRTKFTEAVFVYRNGREQKEEQLAAYAGRTSLVMDFFTQGQAAVRIRNVQMSDSGIYICFFKKGVFNEEAILELKVTGLGSVPEVHIQGPEDGGVLLVCTALGWFPKPQVQWIDPSGETLQAFFETYTQDTQELFSVETRLMVRDSSVGNVTCSILNPILGQDKAMAISIPEPFFSQAFPWKLTFAVILTMMGLLLFGAGCFIQREYSIKLKVKKERKSLQREGQPSSEKGCSDCVLIRVCFLSAWKKAQIYAGPVTLDPDSAHPSLAVSQDRMTVTCKDTSMLSNDTFSVLGLEGILSGRCYWEVEVKNTDSKWTLGVCRKDEQQKDWNLKLPRNGFWIFGLSGTGYWAYTEPWTSLSLKQDPCRVGVFVDYSEGDVSFYNMSNRSHIFSFQKASFSGTLLPYFSFTSGDVSLTICSMVSGPEGLSVPLRPSPSVEEILSAPGEELNSGSAVDDSLPGAEFPLLPCSPETVPP